MKVPKLILVRSCRFGFLGIALWAFAACSAFERKPEAADEPPFPPSESGEAMAGGAAGGADDTVPPVSQNYMENELARLNTKIEALETKLAALDSKAQETSARSAQPRIRAEEGEQEAEMSDDHDPERPEQSSVASRLATKLPGSPKATRLEESREVDAEASPSITGNVEQDFRASMQAFEAGDFKSAANRFFAISKEYKNHTLAGHALYWAGESAARARNWKIAIAHFTNLEANYPRSIYVADALAGLANAYASSANTAQAKHYREVLTSAFPDSPAASNLGGKLSQAHQEGE